MLERVLGTSNDKLVAEHVKCAIPVLVREIDSLRSVLGANVRKSAASRTGSADRN